MRTSLTALALAAGIPAAMAAEPQQFPATLAGHALLPAATSTAPPADAPGRFQGVGQVHVQRRPPDRCCRRRWRAPRSCPPRTPRARPASRSRSTASPFRASPASSACGDGTYWVLTDNGFGAKANSSDAMLMLHNVKLDWDKRQGRDARHDLPARPGQEGAVPHRQRGHRQALPDRRRFRHRVDPADRRRRSGSATSSAPT